MLLSTDPSVGTIAYNAHGDTTSIHGESHSYDALDEHTGTTKGSTSVTYVRDATGRIVERDLNGAVAARYSYGGPTDTSAAVLNGSDQLVAATVALPGGVMLTQQASGDTWSYTNVHGDVCATANAAGAKQGSTAIYDPFGNTLAGTPPDNSPGSMDDQWPGGPQRPAEHETGLAPIVEMGARQYDPDTGRLLSIDPIPGGSANQYDYAGLDPINGHDFTGAVCWSCLIHNIGHWAVGVAVFVWHVIQKIWQGLPGKGLRCLVAVWVMTVGILGAIAACATVETGIGAAFCIGAIIGRVTTIMWTFDEARALSKALGEL